VDRSRPGGSVERAVKAFGFRVTTRGLDAQVSLQVSVSVPTAQCLRAATCYLVLGTCPRPRPHRGPRSVRIRLTLLT
jgi:hypothetical protein